MQKTWMYLMSSQFDSRREGATGVLTLRGVEAAEVGQNKDVRARSKSSNGISFHLQPSLSCCLACGWSSEEGYNHLLRESLQVSSCCAATEKLMIINCQLYGLKDLQRLTLCELPWIMGLRAVAAPPYIPGLPQYLKREKCETHYSFHTNV